MYKDEPPGEEEHQQLHQEQGSDSPTTARLLPQPTPSSTRGSKSTNQEDSDGVMLDRDQPLHSTPVLVARPPPSQPPPSPHFANNNRNASSSSLNGMMASMIPTMTSMLLPPSSFSYQHQDQQGNAPATSSYSKMPQEEGEENVEERPPPNQQYVHTDSFLSSDSDDDGDLRVSMSDDSVYRRSCNTLRYIEEASMEVHDLKPHPPTSEDDRFTALPPVEVAPSGKYGRRRPSAPEAEVILIPNNRRSNEAMNNRSSVHSSMSSVSSMQLASLPQMDGSFSDSLRHNSMRVVAQQPSAATAITQSSPSIGPAATDTLANPSHGDDPQQKTSPALEDNHNLKRPAVATRLRTVSDGGSAVEMPARQPQEEEQLRTALAAGSPTPQLPETNRPTPVAATNRASSTGNLLNDRSHQLPPSNHHRSSPLSTPRTTTTTPFLLDEPVILEEPNQVWELLQSRQVIHDHTSTGADQDPTTSFVAILHVMFEGWTSPNLTRAQIQALWDYSSSSSSSSDGSQSEWPEQPILHASTHSRPLGLLCAGVQLERQKTATSSTTTNTFARMPSLPLLEKHESSSQHQTPLFWQMPSSLLKVFLRVLTRLITLDSNEDYDQHVSPKSSMGEGGRRRPPRLFAAMEHEAARADIVYNVVRLSCCKLDYRRDKNQSTSIVLFSLLSLVDSAMFSLEHAMKQPHNSKAICQHYSDVLPSLIYLLGVWAVAGTTPLVLRRWIALIQSTAATATPTVVKFRDALVRALTFATHYSSLVIPPRCFFTFQPKRHLRIQVQGPTGSHKSAISTVAALKRSIRGLNNWPFRNDFGMATWFRAEHAEHKVHLVSIRTDQGAGWTISLQPLPSSGAYTIVVSVYDSGHASPTHQLTVSGCVLVPRNWYHVAVRHTRSRLKGVFSLSTRQQLVLMLDGKIMVNQPLPFPRVENRSNNQSNSLLLRPSSASASSPQPHASLNLEIEAAVQMEGQMGALYIFRENVSDASFRGIYEATGGKDHRSAMRRLSLSSVPPVSCISGGGAPSLDSRHHRKPRGVSDPNKKEESNDIGLVGNGMTNFYHHGNKRLSLHSQQKLLNRLVSTFDFDDIDITEGETAGAHQELPAVRSKVFLVWDPQRAMNSLAFELHVGAHVILDDQVHTWHSVGTQDVIASIGGVQALIPLFRSMIAVGGPAAFAGGLSVLANLFRLLASFVHGHDENARELLRCGGVDVIEQLLLASKRMGTPKQANSTAPSAIISSSSHARPSSLFASLCTNHLLATELVEALLVLQSASQHHTGLENKLFGRLLFNIPLWLGNSSSPTGAALHLALLPALSFLAKNNPDKVRDSVGAKEMIHFVRELAMVTEEKSAAGPSSMNRFLHQDDNVDGLASDDSTPLTSREQRHVRRIVLGMMFEVLASRTLPRDLGPLLRFISNTSETNGQTSVSAVEEPSLRHQVQLEACTILVLLLQISPSVSGLMESFAHCCGSVQAGIGWILSVMIKPPDEKLVALGIRCVFAYLRCATKGDDHPISLHSSSSHPPLQQQDDAVPTTAAEAASKKTVALASSTVASFAKGLAAIGPGGRASMVLFPSKLTARVVYKLLWHLLKGHRFILGPEVRSALLYCMSDAPDAHPESMLSSVHLLGKLVIHGGAEKAETSGCWFSYDDATIMLQKSGSIVGRSLQNRVVIATVLRLLRYLPAETTHQWLIDLVALVRASRKSISLISSLDDWQSCMFHLASKTVEELCTMVENNQRARINGDGDQQAADGNDVRERLDLTLALYATLLGHLLREGGEKALGAVEHTASLQRVCVNGQVVLLLVLSALSADLFDHGTLLEVGSLTAEDWKDIDLEQDSLLLKQSAKLVTDAILSNGTEGLDMAAAVRSWRSLRHLAEVVVAVVTMSGLGVVDLFAYNKHRASAIDSLSGGLHGIRLPDTRLKSTTSLQYAKMVSACGMTRAASLETSDDMRREIDRRLCVALAAQVLTLLDAFIFPDSLDTSLPASQLHGLALVRNSEPRLGAAQGPLIASAIRLSFLLMSALEPCSVRMLQCVSRLRCLVQWALDLIRESSSAAAEGPDEMIASLDRLLVAVVLHCHRTLGRCAALLSELEPSSLDYSGSKDAQKKHYRRLLRVALELRDVVTTTYRGRNVVVRSALSTEAVQELRSSLEGSSGSGRSMSREAAIKEFLSSGWVTRFQDVEILGDLSVPEQAAMDTIALSGSEREDAGRGIYAVQQLASESTLVQADFEKALNVPFEGYLEAERKWADTENVRYLEYDGDTTTKKLSEKQEQDITEAAKEANTRRFGADTRWNAIHRRVVASWASTGHWKLAEFTDRFGRRTVLVPNRNFNAHSHAAYDADKSAPSVDAVAISRGDSELTELIRRYTEAFTVSDGLLDDDDPLLQSSDGESVADLESSSYEADDSIGSNENDDNAETEYYEDEWDKIDTEEIEHVDVHGDGDGWARAFVWSENESVVARFEPVMIVTLQTYVEGKLLLTSHSLYFKSAGSEIDVMTKKPIEGASDAVSGEPKDRRWRLSRLTEIHGRRYLLRQQAIELFFSDCHELFLNFSRGIKERDRFHAKLRNSCKVGVLMFDAPVSLSTLIL